MNRKQYALVALGVALLLVAYPLAFPPADPGTQQVTQVTDMGELDEDQYEGPILDSETFSDDELAYFEDVVAERSLERSLDATPERFQALLEEDRTAVVAHEDTYYRVWTHTTNPGPELLAVLPRILSFVLATLLGAVGGYLYVNADG